MNEPQSTQGQFRLDGKIAIITGGGSGIGRAIARRFAKNGARVAIVELNHAQGEATANEIAVHGGEAQVYECDVSNHAQVNRVFAEIFQRGRAHILVNNAGISNIGSLERTNESDFDRVFRVNVRVSTTACLRLSAMFRITPPPLAFTWRRSRLGQGSQTASPTP